ncbi:hypothetical protein [Levilactobacillus paucivorans]|nr:hypothetical protein [Levilactobacillus paucivorans]
MLKHKLITDVAEPLATHHDDMKALVTENPWLIPATLFMEVLPATVIIHGYWKTRQLKKQLQIERERTKQLQLEQLNQLRPGHHADDRPRPLAHHRPFHHDS